MMTNAIIKMNGNEFDISKIDSNALTISKAELANSGISENDKCYDIALQIKLTGKVDNAIAIERCRLLYELKKKAETDFKSYCEKINLDNYSNCNKDALVYERILSNDEYKELFKYCSISFFRAISSCKNIAELVKAINKGVIKLPTMTKKGLEKGSPIADVNKLVTAINSGIVDISKANLKEPKAEKPKAEEPKAEEPKSNIDTFKDFWSKLNKTDKKAIADFIKSEKIC